MFHDEARITVRSGKGGAGAISFRREKYLPWGGPDGGDGGDGGDVVMVANPHLNTLNAFIRRRTWKADSGQPGGTNDCTGADGEDLEIETPVGTVVRLAETGEVLADLVVSGQRVILAAGGRGGRGNAAFKSSVEQAPRRAEPGQPGVSLELALELKLIADAGIMGQPNAGKSTLLARLSSARPKIGPYPFTTLEPQLGVVVHGETHLVLADIPGLIDGASEGHGLGHRFLRHVERCPLLVHLVDGSSGEVAELAAQVRLLDHELAAFSPTLAAKPQLVVLNKLDTRPELPGLAPALSVALGREVLVISAVSGAGCPELVRRLLALTRGDSTLDA